MARVRSPNYPALSLPDAVDRIGLVHELQQTTAEPREVVVKHMGYSSSNGRALKSLSALIKYGFLDDKGAEGLSVSSRAVAILYPENKESKNDALLEAARSPSLFADIFDRWDGKPSEESLKAYLVRAGFNIKAVDTVARTFNATFDLVKGLHDSYDSSDVTPAQKETEPMPQNSHPSDTTMTPDSNIPVLDSQVASVPNPSLNSTKPIFDFDSVTINSKIDNQDDLEELISRLEQIKAMLPAKTEH